MKEISEEEYEQLIDNKNELVGWVRRTVKNAKRIYILIDKNQKSLSVPEILNKLTLTHIDIVSGEYEVRCHWMKTQYCRIKLKLKK